MRTRRFLALIALLLVANGCAKTRGISVHPTEAAYRVKPIDIIGYTTHDEMYHSFDGTAQLLDDGSWHFVSYRYDRPPFPLPADQVTQLKVVQATRSSATAAVLLVTATVAISVFVIAFWHSLGGWTARPG